VLTQLLSKALLTVNDFPFKKPKRRTAITQPVNASLSCDFGADFGVIGELCFGKEFYQRLFRIADFFQLSLGLRRDASTAR
jgi:hypothetical protein